MYVKDSLVKHAIDRIKQADNKEVLQREENVAKVHILWDIEIINTEQYKALLDIINGTHKKPQTKRPTNIKRKRGRPERDLGI